MKRPPDMSLAQFTAALKRNGFKYGHLFWFYDTSGQTSGVSYAGIFTRKGKLLRRATLAHLIRQRNVEIVKNENAIRSPGFTNPDAKTVQECHENRT